MTGNAEQLSGAVQDYSEAESLYETAMGYLKPKEIVYGGKTTLMPGDGKAASVLLDEIVRRFSPHGSECVAHAVYVLAALHEDKVHPNASTEEAIRLYKIASSTSQGANAKLNLGLMYLEGWKTEHNPEEGLKLIREALTELEASSNVDPWYYERLGSIYRDGKDNVGQSKNLRSMQYAVYYYEKAVQISIAIKDQERLESARDGLDSARRWCDVLKT
jgi:TPR repeat protein